MDWFEVGKKDSELGNDRPALTDEDFFRDIEDPQEAREAADAYSSGFNHHLKKQPLQREEIMARFQKGQEVVRYLSSARIPMPLTVTKVHEGLVHCGPWTFDDETGIEEDPELGWGRDSGITGSWIEEKGE